MEESSIKFEISNFLDVKNTCQEIKETIYNKIPLGYIIKEIKIIDNPEKTGKLCYGIYERKIDSTGQYLLF